MIVSAMSAAPLHGVGCSGVALISRDFLQEAVRCHLVVGHHFRFASTRCLKRIVAAMGGLIVIELVAA